MSAEPCPHQRLRKTPTGMVCLACGRAVVPDQAAALAALTEAERGRIGGLPMLGLVIWAATLPAAILVMAFLPFVHFVLSVLGTLCHELGHFVIAVLTGHLAVPSFDLIYGGGVTRVFDRSWWVMFAVAAVTARTAWRCRERPRVPLICAIGAAISLLLIVTGWDDPLCLEMGHGGQLLAGGIFLYRGLTGAAEIYPGERWLYGFVGWSLVLDVVVLCWSLTHDPDALNIYLQGKGGTDNDFVRVAETLGTSVATIAWTNLILCLGSPAGAALTGLALRRDRPWRT